MKKTVKKNNFFEHHPVLTISIVVCFFLIIIELLCGGIILVSHSVKGVPKRLSVFKLHPFITRQNIVQYETHWQETFPVFGYVNRIHISQECGQTTDRYGFIHNGDPWREIKPEDFIIFIVGGSTVVGLGTTCNSQTFAAQLEQLLSVHYPHVKVINAGVSGYYSPMELMKITNEIMFYNPDVIISFGGTNEFEYDYVPFEDRQFTYFINNYNRDLFQTLANTQSLWWSLKNLVYNMTSFTEYTYTRFVVEKGVSFLMGKAGSTSHSDILTNIKRIAGNYPYEKVDYIDKGFEKELDQKILFYINYVQQTNALVAGMGKKYFYILQPILYTESRILPQTEKEALEYTRFAHYRKKEKDMFQRASYFWDKVDSELRKTKITYYDFRGVFSDNTKVYADYVHYNDEGNRQIAEAIYRELISSHVLDKMSSGSSAEHFYQVIK